MTDRALVLGATFALSFASTAKCETIQNSIPAEQADFNEEPFGCPLLVEAERACFDRFVVEFAVALPFTDAPIILPGGVISLNGAPNSGGNSSDTNIQAEHSESTKPLSGGFGSSKSFA
ncbi:MAG: hypothetical protein K5905_25920 [Roseibium sp.]|uniref:hypothetical protein n=1 Tax=Roseibium sp. TaxID=1936156 RepID=UPI0026147644|nr:hypothetical protein [Roseibium sp.]MCV0428906.1 hypothetical protein [Roseibium sp.]